MCACAMPNFHLSFSQENNIVRNIVDQKEKKTLFQNYNKNKSSEDVISHYSHKQMFALKKNRRRKANRANI